MIGLQEIAFRECTSTLLRCTIFSGRMVAVGTTVTGRPPHRSRRALLTHRAPPSGFGVKAVTWQRV
jgi:hypothetical protein